MKTNNIQLWEILKDGKNGEVFEVVDCVLTQFIGTKVKVKETSDYRGHFKCLVEPDSKGEDEKNLITLYGCLGTAKFKQVQEFESISFEEAVERLHDYRAVYVLHAGEYQELSRYTDFVDLDIDDFSDLFCKPFFVKGDI